MLRTLSLFIVAVLVASFFQAAARAGEAHPGSDRPLLVGTKEAPPFAMKEADGTWSGISIELWRRIAAEAGYQYRFREYDLKGLVEAVEHGEVDLAVAALTVTAEREARFDFTHPFHTTGFGIAVLPEQKGGWLSLVDRFFSAAFLKTLGALALLLGAVGLLVWFFEHRKNPEQFGGTALHGIGSGFWWSAVTMTTVGYGDKTPRTLGGRLVGLAWMFMAIIVISSFTAAITSSLTVDRLESRVKGPGDLLRVRTGGVTFSTAALHLQEKHIAFHEFTTPLEGLEAVAAGRIDALVHDAPILRYLAKHTMKNSVSVLPQLFERQDYAFALPQGSGLREPLNQAIIEAIGSADHQELLFHYLGKRDL